MHSSLAPWHIAANSQPASFNASALAWTAFRNAGPRGIREVYRRDLSLGFADSVENDARLAAYGETAIAFHIGHDSNVAISMNGRVQCVLELERLFEKRYFYSTCETLESDWIRTLTFVRQHCECDLDATSASRSGSRCPTTFDHALIVGFGGEHPSPYRLFPSVVEKIYSVRHWHMVDHHEAHALLGFYDSPFRSALIIAQGLGNDGFFNVYVGAGFSVYRVAQLQYHFAAAYQQLAYLLPEVHGCPSRCHEVSYNASVHPVKCRWFLESGIFEAHHGLSLAGKLMGYAGVGKLLPNVHALVDAFFWRASTNSTALSAAHFWQHAASKQAPGTLLGDLRKVACSSVQNQRAIAASIQKAFEERTLTVLKEILSRVGVTHKIEGIISTGGPALNVLANQLMCENLTTSCDFGPPATSNLPHGIHIPAAPNDCGLSVGALFKVIPPMVRQPLQYLGFRLWDLENLENEAKRRNARRLSDLGGVEYLADLLSGRSELNYTRPIIAVVKGRQEFGPRALGHRSLVGVPDSDEIRDRMNALKFREWYRPVAPMIAEESLEAVFGRKILSPYMTMAPRVQDDMRTRFPALAHTDGTARHQSVGKLDEAWLHSLLLAVGNRTGLSALINTSFNSKGKPITNSVKESLHMFDTLPQLDFVLIEDWLFSKSDQQIKSFG